jgi:hypothetical protein
LAYQLISKNGKPQECWLMATTETKSGDNCTSATVAMPPGPNPRFNRTSFSGIWLQHGRAEDLASNDFVLGVDVPIHWKDVELADGEFNWTTADALLANAAKIGYFIETALQVGPASPMWIYNRTRGNTSVPMVMVEMISGHTCSGIDLDGGTMDLKTCPFPYYLDPTYQELFLRAVAAFASHLGTLPEKVRSRVVASQAMYGTTGDDGPWWVQCTQICRVHHRPTICTTFLPITTFFPFLIALIATHLPHTNC